jgi:hypothetical protein
MIIKGLYSLSQTKTSWLSRLSFQRKRTEFLRGWGAKVEAERTLQFSEIGVNETGYTLEEMIDSLEILCGVIGL